MDGFHVVAIAGAGALVALVLVLSALERPRLVIGKRGIRAPALGLGLIRWEEIAGAYPPSARDGDGVMLKLRVTERIARRLGLAAGTPTIDVRLDLGGSAVSPVQLFHEIVEHLVTRTGSPPDRRRRPPRPATTARPSGGTSR